jgi:hypothetical protein
MILPAIMLLLDSKRIMPSSLFEVMILPVIMLLLEFLTSCMPVRLNELIVLLLIILLLEYSNQIPGP